MQIKDDLKKTTWSFYYLDPNEITETLHYIKEKEDIQLISKSLIERKLVQSKESTRRLVILPLIQYNLIEKIGNMKFRPTSLSEIYLDYGNDEQKTALLHYLCYFDSSFYQFFIEQAYKLIYSVTHGNLSLGNESFISTITEVIQENLEKSTPLNDWDIQNFSYNALKLLFFYSNGIPSISNARYLVKDIKYKRQVFNDIFFITLEKLHKKMKKIGNTLLIEPELKKEIMIALFLDELGWEKSVSEIPSKFNARINGSQLELDKFEFDKHIEKIWISRLHKKGEEVE